MALNSLNNNDKHKNTTNNHYHLNYKQQLLPPKITTTNNHYHHSYKHEQPIPVYHQQPMSPLFLFRRRSDPSEMVSALVDRVPRLLWLIQMNLYYKYKLFRRFHAISLLAQSTWRWISTICGGSNPSWNSIIFKFIKFLFLLQIFTIWFGSGFKVGVNTSFIRYLDMETRPRANFTTTTTNNQNHQQLPPQLQTTTTTNTITTKTLTATTTYNY